MRVEVLLFGPEAAAAGADRVAIELPEGSTCAALRDSLAQSCPALKPALATARFAVNSRFAPPATTISESDEIALIGLVSGG